MFCLRFLFPIWFSCDSVLFVQKQKNKDYIWLEDVSQRFVSREPRSRNVSENINGPSSSKSHFLCRASQRGADHLGPEISRSAPNFTAWLILPRLRPFALLRLPAPLSWWDIFLKPYPKTTFNFLAFWPSKSNARTCLRHTDPCRSESIIPETVPAQSFSWALWMLRRDEGDIQHASDLCTWQKKRFREGEISELLSWWPLVFNSLTKNAFDTAKFVDHRFDGEKIEKVFPEQCFLAS